PDGLGAWADRIGARKFKLRRYPNAGDRSTCSIGLRRARSACRRSVLTTTCGKLIVCGTAPSARHLAAWRAQMAALSVLRLRRALAQFLLVAILAIGVGVTSPAAAQPSGRAVMAFHVTVSPAWFDPSTAPAQITTFGVLYAIHDALVRPYPGHKMGPSLAE